ncbi:hypothetical protein [Microvirga pudoricolor]|uniref:hypothetical protein n=1 Tax=Microvirga pudoricolor TaxID=2778729 RepID=UPI0019507462|nr:hypothetical protein [Microvirga pudoricolor]MBM6593089.1 hypothetical protein [Microvirga pudoricolor]
MQDLLETIRGRLERRQYSSETAVRETIVLPVLQSLGWDIFDPDHVLREFTLGTRRVDYALSATPPRRDIFIEVKAVGQTTGADRQLFEYAFHEGIPFAVLTDGQEWSFFLPGQQGSYDERRVQKLDLLERNPSEAALLMARYLDFRRVKSGEALQDAQTDYRTVSSRKTALDRLPDAWAALCAEPDPLLLDLISEKTEAICGFRPKPEDVEEFVLSNLTNGSKVRSRLEVKRPTRTAEAGVSSTQHLARPTPSVPSAPVSERHIIYTVFGERREARTAIDALVEILRALSARQPDFVDRLSQIAPSRTRNHIARSPEQVYPARPELSDLTTEFVPGWWLGTNIANRDKLTLLRKACEVTGITLGRDIEIHLPNAN